MRKFLLALLMPWLLSLTMTAQNTHALGYCSDDLQGAEAFGVEGEARLSAAICLPMPLMQRYKDGSIVRIKVALGEGMDKASVWIRKSLNESSLVVQSISSLQTGWNEVTLNTPYTVDGSELYIGYTVTQPEGVSGILSKEEGNEHTSLVAVGNEWADRHQQGVGILFIQAIVEADIPARDIAVIQGTADSLAYASGGTLSAEAVIENLGTDRIDSYTLSWRLDDGETLADDNRGPLEPGATADASRQFSLLGLSEGEHAVSVTVTPDGDDAKTANNTLRIPFYVYTSSYPHLTLLEHFTSLPCVNCPPVDKLLENAVEKRHDVVWAAHHVGYKNDEFTIPESEPYLKFGVYGNPFIMLDRFPLVSDEPAFTISSFTEDNMTTVLDMAAERRAFVALSPSMSLDNGMLKVDVMGEAKEFFQTLFPRATLNVFLVEDSVLAVGSQAGDASKRYHDNVVRAVLTRQTGDRIDWTDDTHFAATFYAEPGEGWRTRFVRAVAFVTEVADRATGYPTGQVLNAAQAFTYDPAAVSLPAWTDDGAGSRFYRLDGTPMPAGILSPGLYIVVDRHGARKTVIR